MSNLVVPVIKSITVSAPVTSTGGSNPSLGVSAATTTAAGSMSSADKTKLDGVQAGATANDTDANLKSRANHTGTQTASTISDFDAAVRAVNLTVRTVTVASTVAATDEYLRYDSASAGNITLPVNTTTAIAVGSVVVVRQVGAGQATLVGEAGVTLLGNAKTPSQHGDVTATKVATDTWDLRGGVA